MYLFFIDQFHPVSTPIFTAANRAYRFGEGFFETMLYKDGRLCFGEDHLQRLCKGMDLSGIRPPLHFSLSYIEDIVNQLAEKNRHLPLARIRLSVTCGEGTLNQFAENGFELLVESFMTERSPALFASNGWKMGLFSAEQKTTGPAGACKTASHLVYAMAARFAAGHGLNDAVVLNHKGMVCDTSIANIFMVKNGQLITPPLASGCIDGVLRKNLILLLKKDDYDLVERDVHPGELELADELFITNVIRGICPVSQYNGKNYKNGFTTELAQKMLPVLYQ